jgi:hypothetical protein
VALALPLAGAAFSCSSAASSPASTGRVAVVESAPERPSAATIVAGAPTWLAPGESATVEGSAVRIRFAGVLEDSRCPIGVNCVQAGRARVELHVRHSASSSEQRVEVEVGSAPAGEIAAAAYRLRAEALEPTPRAEVRITPSDYRLRLTLLSRGIGGR